MREVREPLFYAKASVETMMRKFKAEDLPPRGHFHYHQGVFLSGVCKIYEACGNEAYFQYVKDWVDSCIDEKGNIWQCDRGQLDDLQPGILLFPLLERTGDARYKAALDFILSVIRNFPRNEAGGFWHKQCHPDQMWLDGLYMAGPVTAEYGKTFLVPGDWDLAAGQALLMEEKTKDAETGLLYHAWDCSGKAEWADPETGLSPEFWGRSIGWVPVAVLDELDFIPESHPQYGKLCHMVRNLLMAVCKFQSEEGRWYQVVNKPDAEGNWLETSCSCLFVGAVCKAVRKGILPEEYLSCAKKGYEGIVKSLEWEDGELLVGDVCVGTPVGDYTHYINRPTSRNDLHGVGAFLIMCAELDKACAEL